MAGLGEIKQKKDAKFAEEPNLHAPDVFCWTERALELSLGSRGKLTSFSQGQLTAILADEWRR